MVKLINDVHIVRSYATSCDEHLIVGGRYSDLTRRVKSQFFN